MTPSDATSAYLHIPFCRRRCFYCDFPISVVGDKRHGEAAPAINQYVAQLVREIQLTGQGRSRPLPGPALQTIFFGGGTPSLLAVTQLGAILEALEQAFGIAAGAELAIEMDPGTFDWAKVQGYLALGINRISLGSQAFQPDLLAACGRTHQVEDIYTSVALLRRAGLDNFSLDLISGLPGQSLADWRASLEAAIALQPTHVSAYDLVIEPTTVFGKRYAAGIGPLPEDEATAQMYRLAQGLLTEAGYGHYEVSNYAQPGWQCRHNRVYWENRPYYGFGMGAASYTQGRRFARPRTRREYFAWLEDLALGQAELGEPLTPQDRLLETLMLGLRLTEGVALTQLEAAFGAAVVAQVLKTVQPFVPLGWVSLEEQRLGLTDPEGMLFSNQVLARLFEVLDGAVLERG